MKCMKMERQQRYREIRIMEVSTSSPLFFCYYVYNKSLYFYSSILYSPYTKYFLRIYLFNFFSLSPPFSFFLSFLYRLGGAAAAAATAAYFICQFLFSLFCSCSFSSLHTNTHTHSLLSLLQITVLFTALLIRFSLLMLMMDTK